MAATSTPCCASTCPFAALFTEEQRAAMKPVITGDFSADAIAKFKSVCTAFTPEQKAKVHEFIETKFTPEQQAALKAAWGPCCCSGGATTTEKPCACSGGATTGASTCCSGGESSCCNMFTAEQKAACKGVCSGDFSAESIALFKPVAAAFTPEQKECFHKYLFTKLSAEQLVQLKAAMGCHCTGECTCHGAAEKPTTCCSGGASSSCCSMFTEEQKAACKGVLDGDFSAESIARCKAAAAAFTPEQKECFHKFLAIKLSPEQMTQLKAAMGCTGSCTCCGH